MNKQTIRQTIGFTYEQFVCDSLKSQYDAVWMWREFPEFILSELGVINNYDIFCKYRYDLGADVVAVKDNVYYFIQCKNFKDIICTDHLAGFYFFIYENNLNGLVYYNGSLSQRIKNLSKKSNTLIYNLIQKKFILPQM